MEMTTAKTIAVFAVIVGCFAVLYPKIFHPMLMHALGMESKKSASDPFLNRVPPHLRRPTTNSRGGMDDQTVRHMKAGVHPGMRAAAEMHKQTASQGGGGGGKGLMSIVLPLYAVGIVIYLIYTLSKVFGKKDVRDTEGIEDSGSRHIRKGKEPKAPPPKNVKKKQLEKLLIKVDDNEVTDVEMKELRQRLLETEKQMTKILQAMQQVQQKVGVDNVEDVLAKCAETVNDVKQQVRGKKKSRIIDDLSEEEDMIEEEKSEDEEDEDLQEEEIDEESDSEDKESANKDYPSDISESDNESDTVEEIKLPKKTQKTVKETKELRKRRVQRES
ncbi:unnamed protein product [Dimorphilus gyrociliatus]|uniref:Resistance to inhibitors of cholinesterase protein 3 N-terminal domain-containing protein n=1 Tax=Dimorphilus gyrociliatus TaxID=2664684 RepID=A0A7I8VA09_9ANNE|nr:unnamed protein product [Dimorphilus gyrociliatus]